MFTPSLKPGQMLICDNASFHNASQMKSLVESKDVTYLPLPPSSPDLNLIEKYWGTSKARIRKYKKPKQPLEDIADEVLIHALVHIQATIPRDYVNPGCRPFSFNPKETKYFPLFNHYLLDCL